MAASTTSLGSPVLASFYKEAVEFKKKIQEKEPYGVSEETRKEFDKLSERFEKHIITLETFGSLSGGQEKLKVIKFFNEIKNLVGPDPLGYTMQKWCGKVSYGASWTFIPQIINGLPTVAKVVFYIGKEPVRFLYNHNPASLIGSFNVATIVASGIAYEVEGPLFATATACTLIGLRVVFHNAKSAIAPYLEDETEEQPAQSPAPSPSQPAAQPAKGPAAPQPPTQPAQSPAPSRAKPSAQPTKVPAAVQPASQPAKGPAAPQPPSKPAQSQAPSPARPATHPAKGPAAPQPPSQPAQASSAPQTSKQKKSSKSSLPLDVKVLNGLFGLGCSTVRWSWNTAWKITRCVGSTVFQGIYWAKNKISKNPPPAAAARPVAADHPEPEHAADAAPSDQKEINEPDAAADDQPAQLPTEAPLYFVLMGGKAVPVYLPTALSLGLDKEKPCENKTSSSTADPAEHPKDLQPAQAPKLADKTSEEVKS